MSRVPHGSGSHKLNQELRRIDEQLPAIRSRLGATEDTLLTFGCDTGTALVALPLNGAATAAASIDIGSANWLASYACVVVEAVLLCISSTYGIVTVAAHIDGNAVPAASDTKSLAAGVVTRFELGADIDVGQRLAVSFDAASDGGDLVGYVRIRRR